MKHVQLFEGFINEMKKDPINKSIKGIKPKNKKIEEGKAEDDKVEKDLEVLLKKLVPGSGKAETVEGEMVRAIMRIWYRYYNDGDYYFRGYGKETAAPSVSWLKTKTPMEVRKSISAALNSAKANAGRAEGKYGSVPGAYTDKDGYLKGLKEAAKIIVDYVKSKNGKYEENKDHDSRF